jgi:hypothetical protein
MPTRTGSQQNEQANQTYGTQATTANANAQADLSQASTDQANLRAGKGVGANPYLNPQYLSAVNQLRSSSLDQATNAGDQQVRALNARTGGMNSTATTGAIENTALQKARLGSELGAQQTAGDWSKNVGYQLNLAQQPLESAAQQAKLYGTATQGQGDALKNLTQFGLASYGPWMSGISALGGAAGAALSPWMKALQAGGGAGGGGGTPGIPLSGGGNG